MVEVRVEAAHGLLLSGVVVVGCEVEVVLRAAPV
jgi:hypothetical protein